MQDRQIKRAAVHQCSDVESSVQKEGTLGTRINAVVCE